MSNKNQFNRQTSAVEKRDRPTISNELPAGLKGKGFMAFKQMNRNEQEHVWEWSKELIREYLRVLEAAPSNIRDVEDLPFPKEQIKLAIKLALPLYISANMQSVVRNLKFAYKEIGAFQAIESTDRKFVSFVSTGNGEAASISYRDALRSYDKYLELAVAEKKALLHEISDFVAKLEAQKTSLKVSGTYAFL